MNKNFNEEFINMRRGRIDRLRRDIRGYRSAVSVCQKNISRINGTRFYLYILIMAAVLCAALAAFIEFVCGNFNFIPFSAILFTHCLLGVAFLNDIYKVIADIRSERIGRISVIVSAVTFGIGFYFIMAFIRKYGKEYADSERRELETYSKIIDDALYEMSGLESEIKEYLKDASDKK